MAKSIIDVKILGDNKGLSKSLTDSESKIGKFAGNAGRIAAAAAVAVGAAVVAGLSKGFVDAIGLQDNDALIAARLGLDPATAAELGDVAASAYRNAWGATLGETTDAVTSLVGSFTGLSDASLEDLTGQAIALGDVFGIDVGNGIQTASELLSSGLVGSAEEAFDLLTVGLQKMPPAIRDELLEASNEYGDFFADLGISGEEAFTKMTDFAEDGKFGIDKFGDALKELTIRGTDMSTSSVEAYGAAGLSAQEMAERFLAGGDIAKGALEDTATGLLSIEDPVERANAAIALFGSPLEDLSVSEIPAFLEGLTDMSSGLGDVDGAAQDMADTVGGTTSVKLEAFKRQVLGGLADFAANNLLPPFESFLKWSEENWPKIKDAAADAFDAVVDAWERHGEPVFDAIVDVGEGVVAFFVDNWPKVRDAVADVFDWINNNKDVVIGGLVGLGVAVATVLVPAFAAWAVAAGTAAVATIAAAAPFIAVGVALAAIGAAAVWAYQNVGWFRDAVDAVARFFSDTVWPIMQETGRIIVDVVGSIVKFVSDNWGTIQTVTATIFDAVKLYVETVWGLIKTIIIDPVKAIVTFVSDNWETIKTTTTAVFDGVKLYLETVWGLIKTIVDAAIKAVRATIDIVTGLIKGDWDAVWDGIKLAVEAVWGLIKGIVSGAIDGVKNSISTVMSVVSSGWGTIWDGIKTRVYDIWEAIKGYVSGGLTAVVDFITGLPGRVASAIGDGFSAIWDKFKDVVNKIIRTWNNLSFTFPSFSGDWNGPLPGGQFTVGGWTMSVAGSGLSIPTLHSGGGVPGPRGRDVLALLQGGERVTSAGDVARDGDVGGGEMMDPERWGRIAADSMSRRFQQNQRAA